MIKMRAKMKIESIVHNSYGQTLKMQPVGLAGRYPEDGLDEDNTYAKFTPSGSLELTITNPALLNQFQPGETYYLDFTLAAPIP